MSGSSEVVVLNLGFEESANARLKSWPSHQGNFDIHVGVVSRVVRFTVLVIISKITDT